MYLTGSAGDHDTAVHADGVIHGEVHPGTACTSLADHAESGPEGAEHCDKYLIYLHDYSQDNSE